MKTKLFNIFFLLFSFSCISVCLADQITISQTIQDVSVNLDSDGFAEFDLYDAQYLGVTGDPNLPYKIINVLLPPEANLNTVKTSITKEEFSDVNGSWNVRPVPPPATWDGNVVIVEWPNDKPIVNGENTDVYSTSSAYPPDLISNSTSGQIREWQLIKIPVVLFQYYPSVHQLSRLKSVEIVVNYDVSKSRSSKLSKRGMSLDYIGEKRIKDLVVNFDEIAPEYYKYASDLKKRSSNPTGSYVIITTNSISSSSSELVKFIQNKKLRGMTVHLVTEETWGGGIGNIASDNIRSWLKQSYLNFNIEYVLLIGDPHPETGDVPMKMLWPRNNRTIPDTETGLIFKDCPSDYYYSDLTGNWDLDGDGKYGEWEDDFGPAGIDRNYEVIVGRIPYYGDIDDLDSILRKIINYENESDTEWRENVLLPMEPSDPSTPGYHLGEEIKNNIIITNGFDYHRVYDDTYSLSPVPESVPCNTDNVTKSWNKEPFGAVFWMTHGSSSSAQNVMDLSHVSTLNNNRPSFTFQCSCNNSYPERTNNLSYSLLKNGAIATIGATRVSWYASGQKTFSGTTTNSGMTYEYAKLIISEDSDCGRSLQDIKQMLIPSMMSDWMNFTGFTLYGDPTSKFSPSFSGSILSVNPDTRQTDSGKGTAYFDISNTGLGLMNWSASANDSWINITSGNSGTNSGRIIAEYDTNTGLSRTGTITITTPGAANSPVNVKIIQKGNSFVWVEDGTKFSASGGMDNNIAIDDSGFIYLLGDIHTSQSIGNITLSNNGSSDFSLVKYDNLGNIIWAFSEGGTDWDSSNDICIDDSGNIYIVGSFKGTINFGNTSISSSGKTDIFLVKYSSDGVFQWVKKAGGMESDSGNSVAVDNFGNVFITGNFSTTSNFGSVSLTSSGEGDIFLAKYTTNGTLQWVRKAGGTDGDSGRAVAADSSGNVYITGSYWITSTFDTVTLTSYTLGDMFIAKYDSTGNLLWAESGGSSYNDGGYDIGVDSIGNAYVTGMFGNKGYFGSKSITSNGSTDAFIAKYSNSGECVWAVNFGSNDSDQPTAISVTPSGESFISGWFLDSTIHTDCATLLNKGGFEIFAAQFDSSGNLQWAKSAGGEGGDQGSDLVYEDNIGVLYLSGYYNETSNFDSLTLTSDNYNFFVAKISDFACSHDDPASLAISSPSNLIANPFSTSQIKLTWSDSSNNETGFIIERSLNSESGFIKITHTEAGNTEYMDNNLTSNTRYFYRIMATNGYTTSPYSIVSNATTYLTEMVFSQPSSVFQNVRWGDIESGDYDNDGDIDVVITGWNNTSTISKIYRNDNGIFSDINANLVGVNGNRSAKWGDYDNDGDLDLILISRATSSKSKIYKNEGNDLFTDIFADIPNGGYDYSAYWGDYDRDGDLDILFNEEKVSIYQNNNGVFQDTGLEFCINAASEARWIDFDGDQDLDVYIPSYATIDEEYGWTTVHGYGVIYRNNGFGSFTMIQTDISDSEYVDIGDYDNDGDLDIAIAGGGCSPVAEIFRNDGNAQFTNINADLMASHNGDIKWIDFDSDNDLDLLISGDIDGCNNRPSIPITRIYRNEGYNTFTEVHTNLVNMYSSAIDIGDYDNDDDIDIIISGVPNTGRLTQLYSNGTYSSQSYTLADVILILQLQTGFNNIQINHLTDITNDGYIGIEEAIYILQIVAGVRQ